MVSGDVKNPAACRFSKGHRSVIDAINRAGGPFNLPAAQAESSCGARDRSS